MRTQIHPELAELPEVIEADSILRKCVHCGFCTATCPTYQLLGDELDGPRGRIYLIKNLLEENTITQSSAQHLDRCLTCRACETTCPSGVNYGRLLDIGRGLVKEHAPAPAGRRLLSKLLRVFVPRQGLFRPLLRIGQLLRPVLPARLRKHVPLYQPAKHQVDSVTGARVLLLSGCVQSSATPNVVASLSRLLASKGVASEVVSEGCCGALDYHLSAQEKGRARMKQVIDLLYPRLDQVDAIVSSATGCGVTIREYPEILQHDPEYADRARLVAEKVLDPTELLVAYPFEGKGRKVAVQTPCSMQHGLKITGQVEEILTAAGYEIVPHKEGHLCCGSAGSYSILQPELSGQLRDRKMSNLMAGAPEVIVTANVGCQTHLASASDVKVVHWLEMLAEDNGASGASP